MEHIAGFSQSDFDTFKIEGLGARMAAIQARIQPKFRMIGDLLTQDLAMQLGNDMFLHIAKHARRTVNPPNDTWLAICNNKRGYKQHPHFQVGLYDDHLFIWLALIYELPHKKEIASTLIEHINDVETIIPSDYVLSIDHMKKDKQAMKEINLIETLTRFRDVKKAELLVGQHIDANDAILQDGPALYNVIMDTFKRLIPLYKLCYR